MILRESTYFVWYRCDRKYVTEVASPHLVAKVPRPCGSSNNGCIQGRRARLYIATNFANLNFVSSLMHVRPCSFPGSLGTYKSRTRYNGDIPKVRKTFTPSMKFSMVVILSTMVVAPVLMVQGNFCCYYAGQEGCSAAKDDLQKRIYAAGDVDVAEIMQRDDLECCCWAPNRDSCHRRCVSTESFEICPFWPS